MEHNFEKCSCPSCLSKWSKYNISINIPRDLPTRRNPPVQCGGPSLKTMSNQTNSINYIPYNHHKNARQVDPQCQALRDVMQFRVNSGFLNPEDIVPEFIHSYDHCQCSVNLSRNSREYIAWLDGRSLSIHKPNVQIPEKSTIAPRIDTMPQRPSLPNRQVYEQPSQSFPRLTRDIKESNNLEKSDNHSVLLESPIDLNYIPQVKESPVLNFSKDIISHEDIDKLKEEEDKSRLVPSNHISGETSRIILDNQISEDKSRIAPHHISEDKSRIAPHHISEDKSRIVPGNHILEEKNNILSNNISPDKPKQDNLTVAHLIDSIETPVNHDSPLFEKSTNLLESPKTSLPEQQKSNTIFNSTSVFNLGIDEIPIKRSISEVIQQSSPIVKNRPPNIQGFKRVVQRSQSQTYQRPVVMYRPPPVRAMVNPFAHIGLGLAYHQSFNVF